MQRKQIRIVKNNRKSGATPCQNGAEGLLAASHCEEKKEDTVDMARRIKQDHFIRAYIKHLFTVSKAALEVGINRRTFYNWRADPQFLQKFEDAVEQKKDWLENKLFEKVEAGDVACTIFCAKCLLKDRGYLPDRLMTVDFRSKEGLTVLSKDHRDAIVAAALNSNQADINNLKGSAYNTAKPRTH